MLNLDLEYLDREISVTSATPTWLFPALAPVEMPVGLLHLDSALCWCDPISEVDETGKEVVFHRQVIWN
jgi:hypothetical protein